MNHFPSGVVALAKKKRGSGEGTVFQRNDGRWVRKISLGFDQGGKRTQKTVYGLTQKEVNEKLDNLKQQRKHGTKSIVAKDTVTGYLARWLDDNIAINRAAKTFSTYEQNCQTLHRASHWISEADELGWR